MTLQRIEWTHPEQRDTITIRSHVRKAMTVGRERKPRWRTCPQENEARIRHRFDVRPNDARFIWRSPHVQNSQKRDRERGHAERCQLQAIAVFSLCHYWRGHAAL